MKSSYKKREADQLARAGKNRKEYTKMSLEYAKKLEKDGKVDMRVWCQRPGKRDIDGNPMYFTEQHHKKECDVNHIIMKYDKSGLITHVQTIEARYGDVTGVDFRKAQDLYLNAQAMFEALPAEIRKRFKNDAGEYLEFMDDESNRDEAIKLGLIREEFAEDSDGIGEHVKSADDYKEKEKPPIASEK